MLPKWCNAPLQVQRVVIAGGRASYGAADVLVGPCMRIGYEHADSLFTYPDVNNLSTSSQPIRIVTTYPREHTLTATEQCAVVERAWRSSAVSSTCHRWRAGRSGGGIAVLLAR